MRSLPIMVALIGYLVFVALIFGGLFYAGRAVERYAIQREHACQYRQQRDDLRDYLERRDRVAWEPREGYAPWYSADGERVVLWRWVPGGVR